MSDPRTTKIATVALHLAMQDKLREAAGYVARLNGTDGLITAMLAWIDTYIAQCHPNHAPGALIRIAWTFTPTGEIQDADQVDPSMRWAGRLIAARAADDEPAFMALLHGVAHSLNNPDSPRARSAS